MNAFCIKAYWKMKAIGFPRKILEHKGSYK